MTPEAWSEDKPSRSHGAVTACHLFERLGIPVIRGQAVLPDGSVEEHSGNASSLSRAASSRAEPLSRPGATARRSKPPTAT